MIVYRFDTQEGMGEFLMLLTKRYSENGKEMPQIRIQYGINKVTIYETTESK